MFGGLAIEVKLTENYTKHIHVLQLQKKDFIKTWEIMNRNYFRNVGSCENKAEKSQAIKVAETTASAIPEHCYSNWTIKQLGAGYGMSYSHKHRWWRCENECTPHKNFISNAGERFKDIIDLCGYVCKSNSRPTRKGSIALNSELQPQKACCELGYLTSLDCDMTWLDCDMTWPDRDMTWPVRDMTWPVRDIYCPVNS